MRRCRGKFLIIKHINMYLRILKKITSVSLLISITSLTFAQITYENAFPNLTFQFPVEIQNTGVPGDDRLFVVEQEGRIKVFDNNSNITNSTTFLNITNEVDYNLDRTHLSRDENCFPNRSLIHEIGRNYFNVCLM